MSTIKRHQRAERKRKLAARERRVLRRLKHRQGDIRDDPMLTASNIHYELADRAQGLGAGGIGAIHLLARRSGLIEAIDDRLHLLQIHQPYHESDHVLNIAYNVLCGGTCLEDLELRRHDEAYLDGLGAERVPDPTTAGDFCRRFDEPDIQALMNTVNQVRLQVWREQPASFFDEAIIDADGTMVPISLVYKKGFEQNGKSPLLLYSYGSYGYSTNAGFNSNVLSLLDRGFAYALAHIRGGSDMGRYWYEDGKLLNKINTFSDFNDCAQFLVDEQYTSTDRLFARGGSAGGLLMGAIANMRPDLYKGILAGVPFVDVVSTMQDATIPLTTIEWDEWGDPREKEYYDYMLSYSPYDQVKEMDYPNMLITTGYWDSQVQYWEPAKWCAKLRDMKTDNNVLVMKCNMAAGHGGASGRFERLRTTALEYTFIIDLAGIK